MAVAAGAAASAGPVRDVSALATRVPGTSPASSVHHASTPNATGSDQAVMS